MIDPHTYEEFEPAGPVLLAPPEVDEDDIASVTNALRSGWVAPVGPDLDAFESELAQRVGTTRALATSSGTAALHLALLAVGVGPGDEVLVSDLSFIAAPNAVRYAGATPVLIDAEDASWQIDPNLVATAIESRRRLGRTPKAVLAVHLYGQVADMDRLAQVCRAHDIALIEDAAEALGATYQGRSAGSLGDCGVFSFNGNKIITTSGGGMLVTSDPGLDQRARHLSGQARLPVSHYEHDEIGFNYRMSNLLAALGRSQLRKLDDRVAGRHVVRARYQELMGGLEGVSFMPDAGTGIPSWWLTCIEIDEAAFGAGRDDVMAHLAAAGVETRPAWKPMHLQAPYRDVPHFGGSVGRRIFTQGLCLPSGSGLNESHLEMVADLVRRVPRRARELVSL